MQFLEVGIKAMVTIETLESGKEAQNVLKIEMKTIVKYEIETMEY